MIVMKFGGTSLEDANAIRNACEFVTARVDLQPFVVVSACAGVTSSLIEIAHWAAQGWETQALKQFSFIQTRHQEIAFSLLSGDSVQNSLNRDFDEVRRLIEGVCALRQLTPRTIDQFAAYGELWSSTIVASTLVQRGLPVKLVDARGVLITNAHFTSAEPNMDLTCKKALEVVSPYIQEGAIIVTQGFIGATEDGLTTTIGRGGSDYSASIFGSVLNAKEIQIWTDVDGILTADPSLLPEAQLIKEMSFDEASELAYFGARVLHPSTIVPAIEKNIPVRVLNSKRPSSEGTLISRASRTSTECLLKSIAYKEGIAVITLRSTRMLMNHGFLARAFDTFARYKKGVDVVATSEVGISLTVDNDANIEEIVSELGGFAQVRVEKHKSVVCVVGENLKYTKGIAARVFRSLCEAEVNVELISHGGSEINLTFVIDESDVPYAIRSLHDEFFGFLPQAPMTQAEDRRLKGIDSRITFC